MKTKRNYFSPTVQVVEINFSKALLESSASLGGYSKQENTEEEGWSD